MAANFSALELLPPQSEYPFSWTADEHVLSGLELLKRGLYNCRTVQQCSLLWFLTVWLYCVGVPIASTQGAWGEVFRHVMHRLKSLQRRSALLRTAQRLIREALRSKLREPPDLAAAEREAALLVYGDSEAYFWKPHVEPFFRQLRCYAAARGMGFVATNVGLPQDFTTWGQVADDEARMAGWYFSTRGPAAEDEALGRLLRDVVRPLSVGGRRSAAPYQRLPELLRHRHLRHVQVHYRNATIWGNSWGIEAQLARMKEGALLIFYDVDVTIRPDSWHQSLARLLLDRSASRPFATARAGSSGHIFVADSWHGAECINTGFLALRNTPLARHFLRTWRAKMEVAGSWDQGGLAETILEFVGLEASIRTGGKVWYDSDCLRLETVGLPDSRGWKSWADYCECYHKALEALAGPYRRRASEVVSFVDPEVAAVNFVPQNLFVDHNDVLEGTRLVPWRPRFCAEGACREGFLPPLRPLVVHWAGIGLERTRLMTEYLQQAFNLSTQGCPHVPSPAQGEVGAGTNARQIRCCEFRLRYASWAPEKRRSYQRWWGCNEHPEWETRDEECDEVQYGPASAAA